MKKYNITIGAMFKNEADSMEEWLLHYLHRGVDHFYMIDDKSTDDFMDIITMYDKYITLFNSVENKSKDKGTQTYNINNFFLNSQVLESKWILTCDLDEYIWSPLTLNISDIVNQLENKKTYAFGIHMTFFGSNGHIKQPSCVVNSFTKRQKIPFIREIYGEKRFIVNDIKSISLAENVESLDLHIVKYKDPETLTAIQKLDIPINETLLRLNHYRLQSKDRWMKRLRETSDAEGHNPWTTNSKYNPFFDSNSGLKCFKHYITSISPNMPLDLEYSGSKNNYRTEKIFKISNECQNEIEDLDLVRQNIKYNITYQNQ